MLMQIWRCHFMLKSVCTKEQVEKEMVSLRVWSLNGERFTGRTPTEVPATVTWLKGLSHPDTAVPDVLCLQDFRTSMIPLLSPLPYFSFIPMTNQMFWGIRESLGICIASRWPIDEIEVHHTWGDGVVRDLEGVGEDNERTRPHDVSDALILKTQNRIAIACSVHQPNNEDPLRIATHHGFWVRDGIPTTQQMASTVSVCSFLAEQGRRYGGLLYVADYNPDKEGKVLRTYQQYGGIDCLPPQISTTLAAHHPAASLGIRSDCIMIWPDCDRRYRHAVEDIYLDATPGSDHHMVCCTVRTLPLPQSNQNSFNKMKLL